MPIYSIDCPECGIIEDFLSFEVTEGTHPCPDCGTTSPKLAAACVTVGPMPSKPIQSSSAGISIESNSQLRAYKEENPNANFVDTSSSYWKQKKERLLERRENAIKKEGYKDFQEFKTEKRKEVGRTPITPKIQVGG